MATSAGRTCKQLWSPGWNGDYSEKSTFEWKLHVVDVPSVMGRQILIRNKACGLNPH